MPGKPLEGSFAVLAALLLLLPGLGPLMEHHFAERQPGHVHIYFGQVVADHTHPYEEPHAHPYGHEAAKAASGDDPSGSAVPHDTVYLTFHEGISQAFASPVVPSTQLAIVFPDLGNHQFAFSTPGDAPSLTEAFIAPPEKPPRL